MRIAKKIAIRIFNLSHGTRIMSHRASLSASYGKGVLIGQGTYVEKNVDIGDYSYVNSNSYVENCSIGKYCSISSGVYVSPFEHNLSYKTTHPILFNQRQGFISKSIPMHRDRVVIGNDVLISLNAVILQGVSIGDGAVIGAGAVVTRDVEPYEIVGGVPAKHIRYRFDVSTIQSLCELKWWNWDANKIKKNIQFLRNEADYTEV